MWAGTSDGEFWLPCAFPRERWIRRHLLSRGSRKPEQALAQRDPHRPGRWTGIPGRLVVGRNPTQGKRSAVRRAVDCPCPWPFGDGPIPGPSGLALEPSLFAYRVPSDLYLAAQRKAEAEGRSVSEIAREALEHHLTQ